MLSKEPRRIAYRPDLDGLRAVAVILVLFYHAEIPGFSGGFVGVDVFFVLTGFLITSILLADMQANRFSFRDFYLRRIKRLFPALITVVFSTIVAGFFLLRPDDLTSLLHSSGFALVSLSNVYFYLNTGGYFDSDAAELPLVHTWSLSVEEQFYLFWPALLLICFKKLSARNRVFLIGFLVFVTTILSEVWVKHLPVGAYYLPFTRVFEMLLGAFVATTYISSSRDFHLVRFGGGILGLALIFSANAVLNNESSFPGVNALWPCLGTALLIYAGTGKSGPVNQILGNRVFVYIGLLSYSIYLWHWPVIAFQHYLGVVSDWRVKILIISVPLLLAVVTYKWIERPFRYSAFFNFRRAVVGLVLLPSILSFSIYALSAGYDGFPGRFPDVLKALQDAENRMKTTCGHIDLSTINECVVGAINTEPTGILLGDSYAGMYGGFVDVLAKEANVSLAHVWFKATPPVTGISTGIRRRQNLIDYTTKRQALLKQYDFVVLASSWGRYESKKVTTFGMIQDEMSLLNLRTCSWRRLAIWLTLESKLF